MAAGTQGELTAPDAATVINALQKDELSVRLEALEHIPALAQALGPARTCAELCPFLAEMSDDEDEFLLRLAQVLSELLPFVGGARNAHNLAIPLEALLGVEEPSVREEAIKSLRRVLQVMSGKEVRKHAVPVAVRLATAAWDAQRQAAAALLAPLLTRLAADTDASDSAAQALEHSLDVFQRLCKDPTPAVRRSACQHSGVVLAAALTCTHVRKADANSVIDCVLPCFEALCHDAQDMVRLFAVENCVRMARALGDAAARHHLSDIIRDLATDPSWRVRFLVADHCVPLLRALTGMEPPAEADTPPSAQAVLSLLAGTDDAARDMQDMQAMMDDEDVHYRTSAEARPLLQQVSWLLTLYVDMISDKEAEVRSTAAKRLAAVARTVGPELTEQYLLNAVADIAADESDFARASLASQVVPIMRLVSGRVRLEGSNEEKASPFDTLFAVLVRLLGDEFHEVKLNVLSQLRDSGFGDDELYAEDCERPSSASSQSLETRRAAAAQLRTALLPAIHALADHDQWRVRQAAVERLALLWRFFGRAFFSQELAPLLDNALVDKVHSVRDAAVEACVSLVEQFGADFAVPAVVPALQRLSRTGKFLHRMVALHAVVALTRVLSSSRWARSPLLPLFLDLAGDDVPNVRFTFCRRVADVAERYGADFAVQHGLRAALAQLASHDSDKDVEFFARDALHALDELVALSPHRSNDVVHDE